jgi:hypothetical protein
MVRYTILLKRVTYVREVTNKSPDFSCAFFSEVSLSGYRGRMRSEWPVLYKRSDKGNADETRFHLC